MKTGRKGEKKEKRNEERKRKLESWGNRFQPFFLMSNDFSHC